jgi:DNA-binding transcriptional regulator YiaG
VSALADEVRARRQLPSRAMARAIRQEAGVTIRRVAQELGVHEVTVARWESGTRRPTGPHLAAYMALIRELGQP